MKTNVGKIFMRLVDKHFPRHHKCYKLFDRNNIKLSYSCIPNLNNVIRKHNSKLGKIQHHQSPKLAIAFKNQTVLWMGTVLLNALFTKHLLVQLLINITYGTCGNMFCSTILMNLSRNPSIEINLRWSNLKIDKIR